MQSPLTLKPSPTKPLSSIFSVSSILAADKKAPAAAAAARRRAAGLHNGGWPAAPPKAAALHEREEDEITPAELAARPFFYPALTLDMLNKNRLQVGGKATRISIHYTMRTRGGGTLHQNAY